jgi:radical SAM superfamily enzyme YgiQ (UPF0313 family)
VIIWGGYFSANQHRSVLNSGFVDFVINGPGDVAFPKLLDALVFGQSVELIQNLIYKKDNEIIKTPQEALLDQDKLPQLPYDKLNRFYPLERYLGKTFLGQRTAAYHSSMGCPFTCSFCAVVPIYNARWKGKSAKLIYKDIKFLIDQHGADAVEFHDNNFFVSEKRTVEFSKLIMNEKINWWGEGRIDTIDKYTDESLEIMSKAFVLGFPAETSEKVIEQIDRDIAYIKEIKTINPQTEIIIYVYSPVPTEGSEMYEQVKKSGFKFPERLEDWLAPEWQNFDLRKNPLTPWLTAKMINKILGFETVLNAQYPTASDFKLTKVQKKVMRWLSVIRYNLNIFAFPYELKALQKFWLRYRRPEVEGFYQE